MNLQLNISTLINVKVCPSDHYTQWVCGFVQCMQEEKSEHSRTCMLDCLGNIMEDASDFSWDSSKACHTVALTNMEADSFNWTDTDKIDSIRCAHAKRHTSGAQTSVSCLSVKKYKNPQSKIVSFADTFRKVPVRTLHITE